jgi:EAL domain-containing protein (putative c-di-GMP-specific phosphodiesterase class I)
LRAACAQISAWQKQGIHAVPIAVNLSAKQFHQQDICTMVTGALRDFSVEPRFLDIEITETAAMHNAGQTARTLHDLKALGVRIAIDDFGTGYSSLSYPEALPDRLAQDRPLVHRWLARRRGRRINCTRGDHDVPFAAAESHRGRRRKRSTAQFSYGEWLR